MWVKGQSGRVLVDANIFSIKRAKDWWIIKSGDITLGIYESEKQVLKVLTQIENSIEGYYSKFYDIPLVGTENHGIFVMPTIEEARTLRK